MGEFSDKRKRNASGESTTSTDSYSQYIPTPPDGGWGWVIVFASFINHVIVDGITFSFGVFYMEFVDYFGASRAKTALVGSLLAGFYLMSGPIASGLVNRFGCRPVCIAGSIISSAAFILSTFSVNIDMLMVTYGVMGGFGFGLIYLPSIVSVSFYFERRRAIATGIAVCGAGVGGFIFAPAGRKLLEVLDWKNAMYVVAGITLNSAVCGMLMKPIEPPKRKPRTKNVFDRLWENVTKRTNSEAPSTDEPQEESMLHKLQEVRLAREAALREEEDGMSDRMSVFLPGSNLASVQQLNQTDAPSQPNGTIPNGVCPSIVVNLHESQTMLNKGEDDRTRNDSGVSGCDTTENTSLVSQPGDGPHTMLGPLPELPEFINTSLLSPDTEERTRLKSMSATDVFTGSMIPPQRPRRRPKGISREDYARPLYRRDIFYSGSVIHIQQFRSSPDVQRYVTSITTIPDILPPEKESKFWSCIPFHKATKDVLREMLDLSMLKDPVFLVALMGEIFGFIGLFIPFVFVTQRAIHLGIPDSDAAFLLSVVGITNTIGRIMAGFLADFSWVNSLLLHNLMMIVGGLACIFNMFCVTYPTMIVFASVFGLSVATYISLTSIILCDLMGLERLTSSFGFFTLFRGLSSIAGPPAAGFVFDLTDNYDWSFHVGGAMLVLAGSLYCLLHLPVFQRAPQAVPDPFFMDVEPDFIPDTEMSCITPDAEVMSPLTSCTGSQQLTMEKEADRVHFDESRNISIA